MKFEFVDFYPITEKNRGDLKCDAIGTVHIYAIDCELDIRGIRVIKKGKNLFFHFPHLIAKDHETGEKVRFPVIHWTSGKTQKEMMDFLHKTIKPLIISRLKAESKK